VTPGATNRLHKNNRDGTFTDVTERAGLKAAGWASGVCVGDYNNDGFEDIFCTYFGQNRLYRNNGDGTFADVTKAAGLWNETPHLFVSNYVNFSFKHAPVPGENMNCDWKGVPVECGPRGLPTGKHSLYRNNGDGTFSDVNKEAGTRTVSHPMG
jgi:enediyne biosynthesis protein E4